MKKEKIKALIMLEDGTYFWGYSFTIRGETFGEIVFNTGITGYQEILTDPSYYGQIVTMTYPLIGNYGVNSQDNESRTIQVAGFIVREYQPLYSNWRAEKSLADWLKEHNIIGVTGVDTRALTRHIRNFGAMKGGITTETLNPREFLEKVKESPDYVGRDLIQYVTTDKPYFYDQEGIDFQTNTFKNKAKYKIAVLDCGLKYNQLRLFAEREAECLVFPANTPAKEILNHNPDGIFLSNGPGDPAPLQYIVNTVKELLGKKPLFGICLGHQILGQALGATTYKLKFGHRGINNPVLNLFNKKVEITSQNHGFCVKAEELPKDVLITHINLNDNTLEGIYHPELKAFSVQYHPENAPGPHDSLYLFEAFFQLIEGKDENLYS
ncbi:MAG: glutamine-hydrolyzing carbamoyl-phosphate synthase small subunit [Caldimicrobium sp.]|nr:glutamine-hydrolyzing carbamoyl-phosphate synthase small subunit [Caldimicrobium sp.]MCX7873802.1 glutamine-hydrolyzing carbamoyl-phosphate synthase small subunit [Caldimicrobium sp.]MDW8094795.1 glutamine-hydrolyzing carbamoyl-phosphate synthase small subunit [Caldimicrobium sp.]